MGDVIDLSSKGTVIKTKPTNKQQLERVRLRVITKSRLEEIRLHMERIDSLLGALKGLNQLQIPEDISVGGCLDPIKENK